MASNNDPSEVSLSRLKFTNWQDQSSKRNNKSHRNSQPQQTTPFSNVAGNMISFTHEFRRPEAYERMAADKPGEEMARDATIWKLHLEEADEYDQELVKSRNASLDMLLLFAALFSAILTAFLIESKDLLQPDPADMSIALLKMIVDSQQRVELGLPAPETISPTADLPPFSPPMFARWINGIWFCSLALSLSAALLAMLSKEWLTVYLSSRPRPAHAHALLRQSRLEGLEGWWALHIISLLPSLLHLSLLLFSFGLVVYLWSLDIAIAAVIATVIGLTLVFYITTAILGAVYDFCPYVTQIYGYLKRTLEASRSSRIPTQETTSSHTSLRDLQALLWLANNARDPAVVDCSYQALAGLHLPTNSHQPAHTDTPPQAEHRHHTVDSQVSLALIDDQTTLSSLFLTVCERFARLARNRGELPASNWANATRYMKAIMELAGYRREWDLATLFHGPNGDNKEGQYWQYVLGPDHLIEALNASDDLWRDNNPPLHADVHASFVASELVLLSLALPNDPSEQPSVPKDPVRSPFSVDETLPQDAHTIQLSYGGIYRDYRRPRPLAQYSRTLVRASTLLWLHTEQNLSIGAVALNRLLNAIHAASVCQRLNPATAYSTHHPQSASDKATIFQFNVPYDTSSVTYDAQDLNGGLLSDFITLLGIGAEGQDNSVLQTRAAAVRALSTLAPVLLQQVLGLDRGKLLQEFDCTIWFRGHKIDLDTTRDQAIRQMFLILRYLGTRLTDHSGHLALCRKALDLVYVYVHGKCESEDTALLAISRYGEYILPLLESVGASDSIFDLLSTKDAFLLVDLLRLKFDQQGANLCDNVLTPSCFPLVVRMIGLANNRASAIRQLLRSIVARMRNRGASPHSNAEVPPIHDSIEYLRHFTRLAGGFAALAEAGLNENYLELVIKATTQITRLAVGRDPGLTVEPIELHSPAVPGFLDAVTMVAKHCMGLSEYDEMILEFARNVLDLLDIASKDEGSHRSLVSYPARDALYTSLKAIKDNSNANKLLKRMRRMETEFQRRNQTEDPAMRPEIGFENDISDQQDESDHSLSISPVDSAVDGVDSDEDDGWTDE